MASTFDILKNSDGDALFKVSVPVFFKKEKRHWVAYSPDLRTFGFSKRSQADALKDFDKAAGIFVRIHLQRGTLEKTLENFGWA